MQEPSPRKLKKPWPGTVERCCRRWRRLKVEPHQDAGARPALARRRINHENAAERGLRPFIENLHIAEINDQRLLRCGRARIRAQDDRLGARSGGSGRKRDKEDWQTVHRLFEAQRSCPVNQGSPVHPWPDERLAGGADRRGLNRLWRTNRRKRLWRGDPKRQTGRLEETAKCDRRRSR